MHNTLNPLYKYISQLIVEFFTNQQIQPGDRYNLYLEEKSYVQQLYHALKSENSQKIALFSYKHPSGNTSFESFSIEIGETKVLIASGENATVDYFTMLRNSISDQAKGFENMALFVIYSQKLESISKGSESLEKDGMPLHYLNFRKRVEIDIGRTSSLKDHEKVILKKLLGYKTQSVLEDNNSVFDYEGVINALSKGKIETNDYASLGLFPHEELQTKGKKLDDDIENNYKQYARFETIFQGDEPDQVVKELLPNNVVSKFKQDNWKTTDFSDLTKWLEEERTKEVPKVVSISCDSKDVTLWKREDGATASKKRAYNIILFNHLQQEDIVLEIKFDHRTKKEGINSKRIDITVQNSGSNLLITLHKCERTNNFSLVSYTDPDSKKKFSFKILHVPFQSNFLSQFESNFLLKIGGSDQSLSVKDDNILIFNEGAQQAHEEELETEKNYVVSDGTTLKLICDYSKIEAEDVLFQVTIKDTLIPIHIKPDFEPPRLTSGPEVWKEKRLQQSDFRYKQENDIIKIQLKSEQQERTVSSDFRKNLIQEKILTNTNGYSWLENSNESLTDYKLELDKYIQDAFDEFRAIFRSKDVQPSLAFLNETERETAVKYVQVVSNYIASFPENKALTPIQKNLFLLGVIREVSGARRWKLSPYHPLNVAYQLQVNEVLGKDTDSYTAILKRLNPGNLLPYIQGKAKEIYIPTESSHSPEWMYYSVYSDTKQGISKSYVSDLISSKLKDFKNNYSILFNPSKRAPLRINIINQGDCKEVLHGLFEFYRTELNITKDLRLTDLIPLEVFIYGSENLVNKFEELTFYSSIAEIEDQLKINLKTNDFDKEDLLNAFFEKVNFYSRSFPKDEEAFEYAHITFYQFDTEKSSFSFNDMADVKTGLSLNGLLSDVSFVPHQDTYRTGFGTHFLPEESNPLTDLAIRYNAFAKVAANDDPYDSNKALCTTINYSIRGQLEKLYTHSHWVTYIDPRVDLDFFKDNSDLVIVHYSDQYTNSSGYDAITVSRKTEQYAFVVQEFLTKHQVQFQRQKDTIPIINFFNAINGDWLLALVRQRSHFPKEKLSLLSGVKTALTFLWSPCITWVPISLEEILRVSGNAGLAKDDGLFSTKNLRADGPHSDDLLLIGLEQKASELLMHFYPVELKIGKQGLDKKGKVQGRQTAKLIQEALAQEGFLAEFYKNFFAKLVLTSAEKMKLFQIWDTQQWDRILIDYRTQLLNNQFIVSRNLRPAIGDFGLIYFGNETVTRSLKITDHCMDIRLMEQDGYNFLVKSVDELIQLFHHTSTTVDQRRLLAQTYSCNGAVEATPDLFAAHETFEKSGANSVEKESDSPFQEAPESETVKNGMSIQFGTDLNTQQPVVWEPNNSNKVMHTNTGIIGTMGTGKTQFTKSLITQLYQNAGQNIGHDPLGILIFDYKGDYIKDDFVSATKAKVYNLEKLPYNPLKLVTENAKPKLPLHTANDLKETIATAFNLGNVQKLKLRDIILEAYQSKGIDIANSSTWGLPSPTIGDFCQLYLADEKVPRDSLYAAISDLDLFEIFEPDESKTQSLYDLIDGVVVINLSGYDESIQNLIVAITLDAFYTQMQRHGHSTIEGNLRQIRKIILVDEADNFLGKNFQSLRKILKEGREFGVGTVLSTQFLNHFATGENEYSNYILTWVIHRVNEIKLKEVESLFALDNKVQKENLLKTIKGLEKHQSVVNLAGSEPLVIRDKAFWELDKE